MLEASGSLPYSFKTTHSLAWSVCRQGRRFRPSPSRFMLPSLRLKVHVPIVDGRRPTGIPKFFSSLIFIEFVFFSDFLELIGNIFWHFWKPSKTACWIIILGYYRHHIQAWLCLVLSYGLDSSSFILQILHWIRGLKGEQATNCPKWLSGVKGSELQTDRST